MLASLSSLFACKFKQAPKPFYLPRTAGFSLTELIIGVTIVAITLALGAPSFSKWMQSSKIRSAAESIQQGLTLARAEAVKRNTAINFSLTTANGWSVGCANVVEPSESAGCPETIQTSPATAGSSIQMTNSETTGAGVAVTSGAFSGTLSFNGLGRTNLAPGNIAAINVSIANSGNCATTSTAGSAMRCLNVTVSSGGRVRMCDPALPTPVSGTPKPSDAQAC